MIYFVRIGEDTGPIKIGLSVAPERRLKGLACHFQSDATLLAEMPGEGDLETTLHERFEPCRVMMHNELFHETPELIEFMRPHMLPEPRRFTYRTKSEAIRARTGRPRLTATMTPERIKRVGELLNSGMSGPKVAKHFKVSTATIYQHWRRAKRYGGKRFVRQYPNN